MSRPVSIAVVLIATAIAVPGASAVTGVSTITTVAGNGTAGFSGDLGPATSADLSFPSAVAVDRQDNLYIVDTGNNRVREVSDGRIVTIAGSGIKGYSGDGGPATEAELHSPSGIAVDGKGNVYIADTVNNRVREVRNGTITTIAGNGTPGFSGDNGPATAAELQDPEGLAVDGNGNLYIADTFNSRVREVRNGTITTIAGGGTDSCLDSGFAVQARLSAAMDVAVDEHGNVFIADNGQHCVREVSDGMITTFAGTGRQGYSGDLGPATSADLSFPYGVAVDRQDNVYIADGDNAAVRKVDAAGTINTIAGGIPGGASTGDGGPAIGASLVAPRGLALSPGGALYVTDGLANVVREIADPAPTASPPPSGNPPPPQLAAPPPAAPSPSPSPSPSFTLRVPRGQRLLAQHGVRVIATCDAACSFTASGTVRIFRSRVALALARGHAGLSGAGSRTLVLRLAAAALRRVARALHPGARVVASISVQGAAESGQLATARQEVVLSGRRR
jgi:sugar lactone lactonase YvrE